MGGRPACRPAVFRTVNVSNLFDISPVIYTSYSNYTYVENSVTKGAQVPNGYRQLDLRKFSFSATFDL